MELIEEARRAGPRLLHQVDDILDCSALETGTIALANELFSPPEVFQQAARIVSDVIEGVAISASVRDDADRDFLGDEQSVRRLAAAPLEDAASRGPITP